MLKKLRNLFSRKNKDESEAVCGIALYVEDDGQVFVYIRMSDESEQTIEFLASILSMFNPSSFFNVSKIIKKQLDEEGREDLYLEIIEKTAGMIKFTKEDIDSEYEEKPCINPSDVI